MSTEVPIAEVEAQIARKSAWTKELRLALGEVLVGQKALVDSLLLALLGGGHVLLEGCRGSPSRWP
jgi:MoxR-like ATPase